MKKVVRLNESELVQLIKIFIYATCKDDFMSKIFDNNNNFLKRNKIDDVKGFEKEMKRYKKGDVVMFRILRSDTYLYLTLEL